MRRLAEVARRIRAGSRSRREHGRDHDRDRERDRDDDPRSVPLDRAPRRFEIGGDRSLRAAPANNQIDALSERQQRDRQRRPRGNAKAANGGAKTTADGQDDCRRPQVPPPAPRRISSVQRYVLSLSVAYFFGIVQ